MALLALALGVIATVAALRVRRQLLPGLGEGYVPRFLLVQGVAINVALWLVVQWAANWSEFPHSLGADLGLVLAYGLVFFGYSISNVDWTAKKFHDFNDAED